MRLIITRHGETEENKKGIIQGHMQGQLSETGIEQAKKLADRLKSENIDYIFSSDLDRAKHTAEEIAKFHNVPFELRKELREAHFGEAQVRNKKYFEDLDKLRFDAKNPLKMEPLEKIYERANKLLKYLKLKYKGKTILLVSHGFLFYFLRGILLGKSLEEIRPEEHGKNTSITVFEIDEDGKLNMKIHNDTSHLED